MTLASILVPGLIWGMLALGFLAIAGVVARKHWRKLDAERRAALAPLRLLHLQGLAIDEVIGAIMSSPLAKDVIPADVQDRLMNAHQEYLDVIHKPLKGKR